MVKITKKNLISRILDRIEIIPNSDGDFIMDFRQLISEDAKEKDKESNKNYKKYLEFQIMKNGNIYCFKGSRGSHPSGDMEVEAKVWEKVKTAYIKAGYEVVEEK